MKTVSGKLISSKPVSLPKAAKILSGFAGHENGASDAVSVYLKRAADAFNSLVGFHKELKNPHSVRKHRTPYVKIEGNPDNGKVEILKNWGEKKNPDFEVKTEEDLAVDLKADEKDSKNKRKGENNRKEKVKIEQIPDEVAEKMEEKEHNEKILKVEEPMDVEQATPYQVGEKRKNKKHKKEKVRIEQSPDRDSGDKETQVLDDEGGKGKKRKEKEAREYRNCAACR